MAAGSQYRLVLLGESAVGKTSLVLRFVREEFKDFQESTIGAAFFPKAVQLDPETAVRLDIWDTAGQERFHSLTPMYYRNAQAALIVFDITSQESFERGKNWVRELQKNGPANIVMALAGNKTDLEERRAVLRQDAEMFADDNNLIYIETSAKTGQGVNEIFLQTAKRLPTLTQERARTPAGGGTVNLDNTSSSSIKKSCCK